MSQSGQSTRYLFERTVDPIFAGDDIRGGAFVYVRDGLAYQAKSFDDLGVIGAARCSIQKGEDIRPYVVIQGVLTVHRDSPVWHELEGAGGMMQRS